MDDIFEKTILLIEDETDRSLSPYELLKAAGFKVIAADNGKKAADIALENNSIDLIIIDICPGSKTDGEAAARMILARKNIPIIFIVPDDEKGILQKVSDICDYGYVVKNSGVLTFRAAIETAFKLFNISAEANSMKKDLDRITSMISGLACAVSSDREPLPVFGTLHEIADLSTTYEILKTSEESYRNIVENVPCIIYKFSSTRGGIYYSSQAEKILGYPLSYLYENPFLWNKSIHPDDIAKVSEAISKFMAGEDFNIEYRIKNSSGDWLWFNDKNIGRRRSVARP